MRYMGGKFLLRNKIVPVLESYRVLGQPYLEPFVGSAWIIGDMNGERYGYDVHPYLIAMFQALQKGWNPPDSISKEDYNFIRDNPDEYPPLTGFVGFGCSWAGTWFGGYATSDRARDANIAGVSKRSLSRKMPCLMDVKFEVADYRDLKPEGFLIYCDPPYQDHAHYAGTPEFSTSEFWEVVRLWSKFNTVICSEYEAPGDFEMIAEFKTQTGIGNKSYLRLERLFKMLEGSDINMKGGQTCMKL